MTALEILIEYLCPQDELNRADAIFVFGGYNVAVPQQAAKLYHQGLADTILLAGKEGMNPLYRLWNETIAERFYQCLREEHVPSQAILIEAESCHTLDDVLMGMPVLIAAKPKLEKIIIITDSVHQRRCLATIRHHYPQLTYLNTPVRIPETLSEEQGRYLLGRSLGEIERLQRYAAQNDIEAQQIPLNVLEAYQMLRANLTNEDVY